MATPGAVLFSFTDAQVSDLRRVLTPKQADQAMYQAVVRTTRRAQSIAVKAVQERLTIPRKYIDDANNRHSAIRSGVEKRSEGPQGRLVIRERQLPLSAFKARTTKAGTTVTIDKTQPPLTFRHAFTATVRSKRQEEMGVSHKGVFQRQRVSTGKADRYVQKNKLSAYRTAKRGAVTPQGFAWRLPIGELFGPSVLDFISRGEIRDAVLSQIGRELDKQLDSQVSRFTKGRHSSLDSAMAAITTADTLGDPDTNANA